MPGVSEDLAIYLRLAPEFGGTRFGPFEGAEVRLGSDPSNSEIVLPEALGVVRAHVKILRQSDQNIILAPVDRTAAVFLWQGTPRPRQVTTPIAIRPGDSFALVTDQGPRFILELDELPEEIKEERRKARSRAGGRWKRLTPQAFGQEGKRQAWMYVLTTGVGQMAQRAYVYVISGAIFMPRNIIMLVMVGGAMGFGGAQRCSNYKLKDQVARKTEALESCEGQVSFVENMNGEGSEEYSFTELASAITGVRALGPALQGDKVLAPKVKAKAKKILDTASDYDWLTNPRKGAGRANVFAAAREKLMDDGKLSGGTARILAYAAAAPDAKAWTNLVDSEGDDVCGRGPFAMTYRQALNFELDPKLDGLILRGVSDYQDAEGRENREKLLGVTAEKAGVKDLEDLEEDVEAGIAPLGSTGQACVYLEGSDGRTGADKVVTMLGRHLKDGASMLPSEDANYGITARIAKYYAADMITVDFEEKGTLDLSDTFPGAVLGDMSSRGQWVLDETAETIARSIVLPCIAVLNNPDNPAVATTFGEPVPTPINCLVLDWKLRNDRE